MERFNPNDNTCPICLEQMYVKSTDWCLTPCSHRFHPTCIRRWWNTSGSNSCAYCDQSWDFSNDNIKHSADSYIIKASMSGIDIPVDEGQLLQWIKQWLGTGQLPVNPQLPRREADANYRYLVSFIRTKPTASEMCSLFISRIKNLLEREYIKPRDGVYRWR